MAWRSMGGLRLFGWYVLASAIPIALLGVGLAHQYETQMNRRALDQAASEADAIANAGIEPVLNGRDLSQPLSAADRAALVKTTRPLLESGSVLRLRLRDRSGAIVFDAQHPDQARSIDEDDEAEEAAGGEVVRQLTHLNADEADEDKADEREGAQADEASDLGPRAVEAYIPLNATGSNQRIVGVLETYIPYAPIGDSFAASNRAMETLIALGLIALWLALSGITWSVTRRVRRGAAANKHMALHDILTGLPNRALFGDRVAHAINAARRSGEPVGIAIVDLDRFKEVNDTLGHHNGDAYLCHIAEAIGAVLRPGDTLARLGGDEFGLVLPGVDPASARVVLERVQRTLAEDVDVAGVPVSSEASIGIAFWPTDGTEMHDLLQCADLAMYAAKETHQAVLEYTTDLSHFSPERLALVSELRHAISANELVLHYQPKLDLRANRIRSVEALLRWQHPTRGLLPPAEFLEVAETTGLIDPLTDWVLDNAIKQIAQWHREGVRLDVAVNVSARNLRSDSLSRTVFDLLARYDVDPECLEIEITETSLIVDPVRATSTLQRLRDHGVRVSLDDFGRGYTSFAQLGSLPLTELKIDGSFVMQMLANSNDHTIVTTVIELGHNFGLEVVGEGAESEEIVHALTELGCDTAQGFALTPALPPAELTAWVHNYERTAPAPLRS